MAALKKFLRKRAGQPEADTVYRAAALAAALIVLAASPLF
jgi:hypothetical protein